MFGDFEIFYRAAQALLAGISPYTVPGFYNPAWALLPFIPLTLFPINIARVIYPALVIPAFILALRRFRLRPRYVLLVSILSSLLWINILWANVDWLVLLGATLPPPVGIWLVMAKPQVGIGVVLFWLLRRASRRWYIFAPVGIALLLNYALLGLPTVSVAVYNPTPASAFPFGIPIAAWLIWRALKKADIAYAVPMSAFLSPYYSIVSWSSLAPLARSWRWLIAVIAASWIIVAAWWLASH